MKTVFTRRQVETVLAAGLAAVAALIGISTADNGKREGPKFLTFEKIGRFKQPVHLSQPPGQDSPLFVVERGGTVKVIVDDEIQKTPFLNIRGPVKDTGKGGEQGLLSIAFSPDYSDSGLFYVAYTDHRDALRVVEFKRSARNELRADPSSARLVMRIPEPTTKHHGGLLLFGPDKHLYIGSGDGGPSGDPYNVAQNKRVLQGKLLRIDPRPPPVKPAPEQRRIKGEGKGKKSKPKPKPRPAYTIPKDNPFVGRPGRDEIFAYGLRNPWRFSFDRGSDALTIGDVGDESYEEVDILPMNKARGANFGWSSFEGPAPFKKNVPRSRTVEPIFSYGHNQHKCSIVGGFVVRDPRLSRIKGREIVGRYLFADFCGTRMFAFRPRGDKRGRVRSFRFDVPGVTSFGEDRKGRIYVLTYGDADGGFVYRLDPARKDIDD
jgi:glucose/arabinose dehydrogenase